jgi:hypothetical protein
MNEYPILFSTPMVQAILDGRKTQTRRVMKVQPENGEHICGPEIFNPVAVDRYGEEQPGKEIFGVYGEDWSFKFPYGMPGDHLWVKETYVVYGSIYYRADGEPSIDDLELYPKWKWKSSRFMPRIFSRIILEIINVRVERIQDISELDAMAEGIYYESYQHIGDLVSDGFQHLWDSINAKRGFGWNVNPLVWVIEFKKISPS